MPVVSIFHGEFCSGREVAQAVAKGLGFDLLDDAALFARVGKRFLADEAKLAKVVFDKPSVFNQFSHDRERCLSWLKVGMAEVLAQEDLVYLGHGALLIPSAISHVLAVCLIADFKHRVRVARRVQGIGEREAQARVRRSDETAARWAESLKRGGEPWSADLYDILIPMDKQTVAGAAGLIMEHVRGVALVPTATSRQAVADFALAAQVEAALAAKGHNPGDLMVEAAQGHVLIKVNKKVMMLSRLEEDLSGVAGQVPGVTGVSVQPGPGYYQADVYRRADFELPSKVLLVDDEREFVQTLSERLMMRDIGSAMVYDGEQALDLVKQDEPEVMVLDLKMPGIDGIEVLRRLKREHPAVEVIILTGHGSDKDREVCMQLGAFAYLEKPVDVDQLHQAMREAYEKIKAGRA